MCHHLANRGAMEVRIGLPANGILRRSPGRCCERLVMTRHRDRSHPVAAPSAGQEIVSRKALSSSAVTSCGTCWSSART